MGTAPSPGDGEVLYKVTSPRGYPVNGGDGKWSLPRGKRPGAWRKVEGDIVMCHNGLHVVTEDQLRRWLPSGQPFTVWEVEVHPEAQRVDDHDKSAVSKARLVRAVATVPEDLAYDWATLPAQSGKFYPTLDDLHHFLANVGDIRKARKERKRLARRAAAREAREQRKKWGYGPERLVFGRDRANGDIWCPAWPRDLDGAMLTRTFQKGRKALGLSAGQDRLVRNAWKAKQDLAPYLRLVGVRVGGQLAA